MSAESAQSRGPEGERQLESILFHGGPIRTMMHDQDMPEAVLVQGGRVTATGDRAELARMGTSFEIDLDGRTLLPGIVDIHPHLMQHGEQRDGMVDLSTARNHDDIIQRIAERARSTPPGQWIQATPVGEPFYYITRNYRDLEERVLPDRHVLDRATQDHPVVIRAWAPTTPNVCAFNTLGLRSVGLTDYVPDRVSDVWLDKDASGSLTGHLRGTVNQIYSYDPFWTQILRQLPSPDGDLTASTVRAMRDYNARGVTTVFEPHNMWPRYVDAYRGLHDRGELSVRVMIAMEAENYSRPPFQPATMSEFRGTLDAARERIVLDSDMYRLTGVSLGASGGPAGSGHMCMPEPYLDAYGRQTKGVEFVSRDKIVEFARYCLEYGLRANFLVSGYRDHDVLLSVLEDPEFAGRIVGKHWVIEHALLITEPHARRYQRLGFAMTTSPGFSWSKGDLYEQRMGRHVWRDLIPLQRLLRVGLTVACGSDWGPKNPFEQMHLAIENIFAGSGRQNLTPDHGVSREDAVRMWTSNAAEVLGWPEIGRIRPGSYGDLTVVDRDPLTCGIDDLPATEVLLTLLDGRVVHDAGGLVAAEVA